MSTLTRNRLLRRILELLGFVELTLSWSMTSFDRIELKADSAAFMPGIGRDWLDVYRPVRAPSGATFGVVTKTEGCSLRTVYVIDSSVVNGNFAVLLACCMAGGRKRQHAEEYIHAALDRGDDDTLSLTAWEPRLHYMLSSFYSKMMERPAAPSTT